MSHEEAGISTAKRLKDLTSSKLEGILHDITLRSALKAQIGSFKQSGFSQLVLDQDHATSTLFDDSEPHDPSLADSFRVARCGFIRSQGQSLGCFRRNQHL